MNCINFDVLKLNTNGLLNKSFYLGKFLGGYYSSVKNYKYRIKIIVNDGDYSDMVTSSLIAGLTSSGADVWICYCSNNDEKIHNNLYLGFFFTIELNTEGKFLNLIVKDESGEDVSDKIYSTFTEYYNNNDKFNIPCPKGCNLGKVVERLYI